MATDERDFDEDEYDDRPRRRRDYELPHRGGLILALGAAGLITSCGPLGIVAWILGNGDLKAMGEGRMDPEGRQLTQVGKILGMVSVMIMVAVFCIGLGWAILMIGLQA